MKKKISIVSFLFIALSVVTATPVIDYFPQLTPEKQKALLAGEMVEGTSIDDEIMSYIPSGSIITDTAEEVSSYEKGFVVAINILVPYPETMKGMNDEEKLLYLYNNSLQVSTMKGIEYISHRAGDKLKVLFDDASMLSSSDASDRIEDPEVKTVPDYAEHYVYMKDTSFGKNVYRIEYKAREKELALEMRNTSELKFMGIGIVAPGKVAMSLDMILTDEGILFSGLASIKDKTPKINLLVYTIDLEESILNRVIALKDWYFGRIGD
ncbi:MAG: hypothetical protein MSS69_05960 [Spirochaetales bacterium]|nr:hypothetical protein [Spirochaetales bacterium]